MLEIDRQSLLSCQDVDGAQLGPGLSITSDAHLDALLLNFQVDFGMAVE
jgi:hypothetical protein